MVDMIYIFFVTRKKRCRINGQSENYDAMTSLLPFIQFYSLKTDKTKNKYAT